MLGAQNWRAPLAQSCELPHKRAALVIAPRLAGGRCVARRNDRFGLYGDTPLQASVDAPFDGVAGLPGP
jgi:hypothetical protein